MTEGSGQSYESIFDAADYRGIVKFKIAEIRKKLPRGAVSQLAKHIRCHPTFFSQVLNNKANFNPEQALAFCDFVGMNKAECGFFLDLLHRDRASDKRTRDFYEQRLSEHRAAHAELSKRWREAKTLDDSQQKRYFQSWVLQAIHLLCRLPGSHTRTTIATQLGISEQTAEAELNQLLELGLVVKNGEEYFTGDSFLHLSADSPIIREFHASWRMKLASMMSEQMSPNALHYSAATTLSLKAIRELRHLIKENLDQYKKIIERSDDKDLYMIAIDFCPLKKS